MKVDEPQTVKHITESDFQIWRHHPVTKVVLGFLTDKTQFLERAALDQWLAGTLSLQADQTVRGQIIELNEVAEMPFGMLAEFYGTDQEKEVNAAQIVEDDGR